ncbi:ATPase [uncultured Clostridium sp.]|uniref:ATPase n=1 Tax=uncultured Clostridium sp. TaxID=59620 RepID=UPI0028ED4109|nr:ATPase [uncultured Clostridium sp.]
MDVIKLLDYLADIVETSSKVPMTGKVMIDKKEVLDVIDKIMTHLPEEFKKAKWVYEEKEKILSEAVREAETLKKENIELLKRQIENHDITREAKMRAEEIISSAQRDAKVMRLGARDYAHEILCQLEKELTENSDKMLNNLQMEMGNYYKAITSDINTTTEVIRENIKELKNMNK